MTERQGLRLAGALKEGHGALLRDALGRFTATDPAQEWALVSGTLGNANGKHALKEKPPASKGVRDLGEPWKLANGITMTRERDDNGYAIRLDGAHVDEEFIETLMGSIQGWLRET